MQQRPSERPGERAGQDAAQQERDRHRAQERGRGRRIAGLHRDHAGHERAHERVLQLQEGDAQRRARRVAPEVVDRQHRRQQQAVGLRHDHADPDREGQDRRRPEHGAELVE
jgi:hypothetical protein